MAKFEVGDGVTVRAVINDVNEHGLVSIVVASQTVKDYRFWCEASDIVTHAPMTLEQRLAGLTIEQIADAISRKDSILADAIEAAGAKIAKARRDSGELRRTRAPKETGAVPAAPQVAGEAHAAQPAVDTPAAEPSALEISGFSLAEMAAKQGRESLDKFMKHVSILTKQELKDRMQELYQIAFDADAAKGPEPFGGEVSAYRLAEHKAKTGRASFDKHIAGLNVDEREEVNEFMPELLEIADAADPTLDPEDDRYIPF